jgi:hypothetical protein
MYVQPPAIGDAEQSWAMLIGPPLPTSKLRVAGSSPAAPTNLKPELSSRRGSYALDHAFQRNRNLERNLG